MTEKSIVVWLDLQALEGGRGTVERAVRQWLKEDGKVPVEQRERRKNLTKRQRLELLVKQEMCCARCGAGINMLTASDDHTVPIARGGKNDISNRRLVCRSCNSSKGSSDLVQESRRTGETILGQL